MVDNSVIEAELFSVIAWQNWHDLGQIPALDPSLTSSLFSKYYNEGEEITSLKFIRNTMPEGKDLSDHLTDLTRKNCKDVVEMLFATKKKFLQVKENILSVDLFLGGGRDIQTKGTRFVGYKIEVLYCEGVVGGIESLRFRIDTAQTDLPIYVFHESQIDPIFQFDVTTTKPRSWESVTIPEIKLPYSTKDYSGSHYYIGYYEEDLVGNALKFNFDTSKDCSCPGVNGNNYRKRAKFITVENIVVKDFVKGECHEEKNDITTSDTHGMNMNLSVKCDLTDFIVKNKKQFIRPMQHYMKVLCKNQYLNTTQINAIQSVTQDYAVFEREDSLKKLKTIIEKELDFDFSNFNSPCLPCEVKRGVETGTFL